MLDSFGRLNAHSVHLEKLLLRNKPPSHMLYLNRSSVLLTDRMASLQLDEKLLLGQSLDVVVVDSDAELVQVACCQCPSVDQTLELLALSLTLHLLLFLSVAQSLLEPGGCPKRVILVHHVIERVAEFGRFAEGVKQGTGFSLGLGW